MARQKKVAAEPSPASAIPDYIQQSRTYQRRRVSKRQLPSFEEAMFLLHAPEMAREYLNAIVGGLKAREKIALEHAGEMLNYVQRKGGMTLNLNQQMVQANAAAGETAPVMGYDALMRKIAEARAGRSLAAPDDVIDVTASTVTTVVTTGD